MTSLQLLLSQGGIAQLKWFSGLQRTFCDLFGLDSNVCIVSVHFLWHPHGPAPLCKHWDSSKGPFSWFAVDSSRLFLPTDVLEWSPQSSVSFNQNLISSRKNWHLLPFCPLPLTNVCVRAQSLSHVWLFCDSMDCSLPGSSVHGIFQVRVLEWVTSFFSRGSSCCREQVLYHLNHQRSPLCFKELKLSFLKQLKDNSKSS